MVVDADAKRLQGLVSSLQGRKVDLASFSNGADAWAAVQRQPPAVILCAALPATEESIQFCARVKTGVRKVRFVAYTPQEDETLRLPFLESGVDEFVSEEQLARILPGMISLVSGQDMPLSAQADRQMFFRLKDGELGNVLQFLNFSARTGRLELVFPATDPEKAELLIDKGEIVHAAFRGLDGLEAIALMLIKGEAEAHFFETTEVKPHNLTLSLSQLLLEATVVADENRDAEAALGDLNVIPQRATPACPPGMEADPVIVWEDIDGVMPLGEILTDLAMGVQRGKRAVKKLLDAKGIRLLSAQDAGVSPQTRVEALFKKVRRRLQAATGPDEIRVLLAHLQTLGRRRPQAGALALGALTGSPNSLKIAHLVCRAECGGQALAVEGSEVECARCGARMTVKSVASYALKS